MPVAMPVSLLEWRPMKRNSLRGFATVRLGKSLKISDIPVHCSAGKRWASLPSKPQIGSDGVVQKDDRGKPKYIPIVSWIDTDARDSFSEGVIQAVEAQYPGDTQGDY